MTAIVRRVRQEYPDRPEVTIHYVYLGQKNWSSDRFKHLFPKGGGVRLKHTILSDSAINYSSAKTVRTSKNTRTYHQRMRGDVSNEERYKPIEELKHICTGKAVF